MTDLLELPCWVHFSQEIGLGSIVFILLVFTQEQKAAHAELSRMREISYFGRLKRAVALRNANNLTVGYKPILILRGYADVGVFLVIDEHRESVGFLVVEIATDILVIRLFCPAQKSAYVFTRVFLVQYEVGIFVRFGKGRFVSRKAEFEYIGNAAAKPRIGKCRFKLWIQDDFAIDFPSELLSPCREFPREHTYG